MDNESDNYVIFSAIFGVLLTISEILPYIKNIKSNGVLQFILEICFLLLKKCKPTNDNSESENLLENVIESFESEQINKNQKSKKTIDITFIDTKETLTITFNSPKEIKIS